MPLNSVTEPVVSSVEINTETPITSIRIISERKAVTAYVQAEGITDPIRSEILTNATVKVAEIVFDLDNPSHVTINTY